MTTLLFLLEELSARTMLESFLPGILPQNIEARFIVFEGKQDLEKRLGKRLREWQMPDTRFVVIHDQDNSDCQHLKHKLRAIWDASGKSNETMIRIPCHELESWYLGDLAAVERALGIGALAKKQLKEKYRNPDLVARSREIGRHLSAESNRSHSFQVFVDGLARHCSA